MTGMGQIHRGVRGCAYAALALCLLLFPAVVSCDQGFVGPRPQPRLVLILCDDLTLDNVEDLSQISLQSVMRTGSIGLMNCAVAGRKTNTAATLTISVGDLVPAEPSDEVAANDWETIPDERGDAREVYIRRAGSLNANVGVNRFAPLRSVKHLGIASLVSRGLNRMCIGALLAASRPPVSTYVVGNADTESLQRRVALLTVDSSGVGRGLLAIWRFSSESPFGLVDDPTALAGYALSANAGFTVIQLGDMARAESARGHLTDEAYHEARLAALARLNQLIAGLLPRLKSGGGSADLLLISPRPPATSANQPSSWDRLTPIVGWGPDFPGGLLTSATTRTPGLISNTDVAPTILKLIGANMPPTMPGRPLYTDREEDSYSGRLDYLHRLDTLSVLDMRAATWVMVPIGGVCFLFALAGLLSIRGKRWAVTKRIAPVMVFTQNLPLACLLATLLTPTSLFEYGIFIAAWMVLLTIVVYWLSNLFRFEPPVSAAMLCLILVAIDTIHGQQLLKVSVISGYALSGIRYYGVGNEYLGILVGFSIVGVFALLDDLGEAGKPSNPVGLRALPICATWVGLLLLLGWPTLGANAGSLIVTTSAFAVAALVLFRIPVRPWHVVLAIAAGAGLALLFGVLDTGPGSSHMGHTLAAASSGRGTRYLLTIIARKLAMNFRLLRSPWLILPAAAVAVTRAAGCRLAGEEIRVWMKTRPWTVRGLTASLVAVIASAVFKDSGVVTVTYLVGGECVMLLYYLFAIRHDLTQEV